MDKYQNELFIIFTGYEEEISTCFKYNQGLKSRFSITVHFDDFNIDELIQIFENYCHEKGFSISSKGLQKLQNILEIEKQKPDFANARRMKDIFNEVFRTHAYNCMNNPTKDNVFVLETDDFKDL